MHVQAKKKATQEKYDELQNLYAAIAQKDEAIKELQEDLEKSRGYCESLQNVTTEYEDYVAELQKRMELPCVNCGISIIAADIEQTNWHKNQV